MKFKHSIVLLLLSSVAAFAQKTITTVLVSAPAQGSHMPSTKSPLEETKGEIRNVDQRAKRITVAHEEIKNLGMPPMTMVFQVKSLAMLAEVKVGDQVLFKAKRVQGTLILTEIHVTTYSTKHNK